MAHPLSAGWHCADVLRRPLEAPLAHLGLRGALGALGALGASTNSPMTWLHSQVPASTLRSKHAHYLSSLKSSFQSLPLAWSVFTMSLSCICAVQFSIPCSVYHCSILQSTASHFGNLATSMHGYRAFYFSWPNSVSCNFTLKRRGSHLRIAFDGNPAN